MTDWNTTTPPYNTELIVYWHGKRKIGIYQPSKKSEFYNRSGWKINHSGEHSSYVSDDPKCWTHLPETPE